MKTLIICICTYKRNESLEKCLKSIKRLNNINNIKIKILIIDNTTNYESFKLVSKIKKKFLYKIIQINEPKKGIVHARNKALIKLKSLKHLLVGPQREVR